jgi:hypothetical protein
LRLHEGRRWTLLWPTAGLWRNGRFGTLILGPQNPVFRQREAKMLGSNFPVRTY